MTCDGSNFNVCDYGGWVPFQCAPGTSCKQNGDYILCL